MLSCGGALWLALVAMATAASVEFTVRETAGQRRFGYPVTASLELPQGALADAAGARLIGANGRDVGAQFTALSKWPDGSVRRLDADFNSSIGPCETESYQVEFGGAARPPGRGGLSVTETPDEITVASSAIAHKIRRDGKPLLTSITNGKMEYIAVGGVTTSLAPGKAEVLKRGPLNVTIRMGPVTLEYVSSKSWVKIAQRAAAAQELTVDARFALAELPVLWDLGVESWLYGCMKKPDQAAVVRQDADGWRVLTGASEPTSVYATGKRCEGWGHLSDKERVVAFGVAEFGADGKPSIHMGGDGRFIARAQRRELTVCFHVVGQPLHVTAATSPPSMLAPLLVEVKRP
jgi:hypothetical protein